MIFRDMTKQGSTFVCTTWDIKDTFTLISDNLARSLWTTNKGVRHLKLADVTGLIRIIFFFLSKGTSTKITFLSSWLHNTEAEISKNFWVNWITFGCWHGSNTFLLMASTVNFEGEYIAKNRTSEKLENSKKQKGTTKNGLFIAC